MSLLHSLIASLKKLFAPLPHLPAQLLRPFVPFLSWYVFLRGLFKIIGGFRGISWGFHYGSQPKMFVSLLDINPVFFIIGGIATIVAGVLYLKSFPALAAPARRTQGWQQWAIAAMLLTIIHLYEAIFLSQSFFWLILQTVVGWYLLFEFERVISPRSAPNAKRS